MQCEEIICFSIVWPWLSALQRFWVSSPAAFSGSVLSTNTEELTTLGDNVAILEENFNAAGLPEGWTANNSTRVAVANNTSNLGDSLYDGNYLIINGKRFNIKSPMFDVTAGNIYTMSFMDHWWNGTAGNGYGRLIFVDAAGAIVSFKSIKTGVSETWTRLSLEAVAPEGAVQAYLMFGADSDCTGNACIIIDSVGVFLSEQPTEPNTEPSEPETEPTEPAENEGGDATLWIIIAAVAAVVLAGAAVGIVLFVKKRKGVAATDAADGATDADAE